MQGSGGYGAASLIERRAVYRRKRPARARTLVKAGRKMCDKSNTQSNADGRDSSSMWHKCCVWSIELRVACIVGGEL
jgi:hypothetical protein